VKNPQVTVFLISLKAGGVALVSVESFSRVFAKGLAMWAIIDDHPLSNAQPITPTSRFHTLA
jgi:hypothetical protein